VFKLLYNCDIIIKIRNLIWPPNKV
jgi:hypothetical protein